MNNKSKLQYSGSLTLPREPTGGSRLKHYYQTQASPNEEEDDQYFYEKNNKLDSDYL